MAAAIRRRRAALAVGAAGIAMALAPSAIAVPSATVAIVDVGDRPIGLADTIDAGSLTVANTSAAGEAIVSFTIDLSERPPEALPPSETCPVPPFACQGPALFPDLAFDPDGGAGDLPGKPLTLDSATGTIGFAATPEYSGPTGEGFAAVTATFPVDVQPDDAPDDFDAGAEATFSFDVDPTSIQGSAAPAPAGPVAGAELHGATVSVTFSDGTTLTNDLSLTPGSSTGARALLAPGLAGELPVPALARPKGAGSKITTPYADQTVIVSGPAGAAGVLVVAEGHLDVTGAPGGGTDLDPYEANSAVDFTEIPFTIGPPGMVAVPLTLTDTPGVDPLTPTITGLNVITAHLSDGARAGPVSEPIVLKLDPAGDREPPVLLHAGPAAGQVDVALNQPIVLFFNEGMDPGTLSRPFPPRGAAVATGDGWAVTLTTGAGDDLVQLPTLALPGEESNNSRFTVRPVSVAEGQVSPSLLAPDTEYRVTLSPEIADLAGNPLGQAHSWTFRTDDLEPPILHDDNWCFGLRSTPCAPAPSAPTGEPLCASVPERPTNPDKDPIRLEAAQLLISQRIAQTAVRRAGAIQRWLEAGVVTGDVCGNAIGPADFDGSVELTGEPGLEPTIATPRPLEVAPAPREGGAARDVRLSAAQLLINQRIAQAAVRRVNALTVRLGAGLTGGDLADGALTQSRLWRHLKLIRRSDAPPPPARTVTVVEPRAGGRDPVSVSAGQLRINQRISQAAVRRVNAIADRLARGLTGEDFRDGSLGFDDLAPDARHG